MQALEQRLESADLLLDDRRNALLLVHLRRNYDGGKVPAQFRQRHVVMMGKIAMHLTCFAMDERYDDKPEERFLLLETTFHGHEPSIVDECYVH